MSNQNFQLVLVNQVICELSGYHKEELLGMKIPDLIHPESLERLPLQVEEARSGKTVKTERLLRRKDGSSVLVEGSVKMLPDGTFQTILHDISERKRAEEMLKRTEAFYRAVIEKSNEGIAVLDGNSTIRYISASGKAIIEFTDEELMGQNRSDLVHPDDVDTFTRAYTGLRPEESVTLEYRIMRKDGTWFWNESHFTNLLDNPAVNGYVVNYRDITERKQAEEKLKETEAFYRAITEKSNEGVMVIDRDMVIHYRTPPQPHLSGYANEEMLGQSRTDLIHPDDLKSILPKFTVLPAEQSFTHTFRTKNQTGGWDWFEGTVTNLLDNPAVNGYVVNYRNISERKQAEEKLQQTEAFYRAVTEKSYEGITVVDKTGKVRYRSTANAALSGYHHEQLTDESFSLLVHPDDQRRIRETFQQLPPNESRLIEFRYKPVQGEWRWLEARITNLLDYHAVSGYVINTRDITERKQAEEDLVKAEAFYRAVTEQSNEGVLVFDRDMIIHYRSPSKLHMASFPYDDMIGKDRTDTIHPDDLKEFLPQLPRLQPGETLLNTFRAQNQNDSWDWFESRVTNLLDHPAVNGYVANYYNINERKEAEAVQRDLSQRLLNVQEEERRSLARELHDEIGQSLTAIKVGLQTAQHLGTPEALTDALRLTDTVLSQVRELSLNLHPRLLEDLGLTAALRWYALEQAKRSGLEITFAIDVGTVTLPPELNITIYRITQEALTNIIRHSQARCVYLSLTAQPETIVLTIKDDGKGFDVTDHRRKESLGLMSMRERASLQGGRLEVRSLPGQGTEIVAAFPLKAALALRFRKEVHGLP